MRIKAFNPDDAKHTIELNLEENLVDNVQLARQVKTRDEVINQEIFELTSLGILVQKLSEILPLEESEQYDVSKLYGTSRTISNMKSFDRSIFKTVYNKASKERIKKMVEGLHFQFGLNSNISENAKDDIVYVAEDVVREKIY